MREQNTPRNTANERHGYPPYNGYIAAQLKIKKVSDSIFKASAMFTGALHTLKKRTYRNLPRNPGWTSRVRALHGAMYVCVEICGPYFNPRQYVT